MTLPLLLDINAPEFLLLLVLAVKPSGLFGKAAIKKV